MAAVVPNFQQILDDHIHDVINNAFGNGAAGANWIDDPSNNVKNKYAVTREYRTLNQGEVENFVSGRTGANLGVIIITNVRFIAEPLSINGKRYGARLETILYNASLNIRSNQIGGSRVTYEMNKDVFNTIINNPVEINNLSIPFVIQSGESEFTSETMDLQRMILIIPTSYLNITV